MAIKIKDCHFERNGTGIKAPISTEIEMSGTTFTNNGKAIDVYVLSAANLKSLGLPENTPQEYMKEVFSILETEKGKTKERQLQSISNSNLFKWLGHGASVATIGSAIITFFQNWHC